jgi:acyl-CoA thioester hydrolase
VPLESRLRRRVQFHETDLAGMVHFSWYFRYMEEAEHGLWRDAGLTIASPDDHLRFVRVSASCDYRAPLRFEDEFDVHIRITAIGSRTIEYACTMARGDTRIAAGMMKVACVDTAANPPKAVDIPARIAEALASN